MVEEAVARRCLDRVREMKGSTVLFDAHAHPFELFYGAATYTRRAISEGIYGADASPFTQPRLTDLSSPRRMRRCAESIACFARPGCGARSLARLYENTGPTVFWAHMDLACIDRILLLPVLRPQEDIDEQMSLMHEMFSGNERFSLGWCVPARIHDDEILDAAEHAVRRFGVRAVKLHPNVTEINPKSVQGRRRIETILETCSRLRLPLIVHGGKSPQLGDTAAASYAQVMNLSEVDWSISTSPMIICHAGVYGCSECEITESLRELGALLAASANMLLDVSALDLRTLDIVFANFDCQRIIFGFDMLYESQWAMVTKVLLALERIFPDAAERFLRIASVNPQRHIFYDDFSSGVARTCASLGANGSTGIDIEHRFIDIAAVRNKMITLVRVRLISSSKRGRQRIGCSAEEGLFFFNKKIVPFERDLSALQTLKSSSKTQEFKFAEITAEYFGGRHYRYDSKNRRLRVTKNFKKGYQGFAIVKADEIVGDIWYCTREGSGCAFRHPDLEWLEWVGVRLGEDDV